MLALRSLLRTPVFTVSAIATLALGIGVNTAVFSVLSSVVFAQLGYPDEKRIVTINAENPAKGARNGNSTPLNVTEWHDSARSFEALAAFRYDYFNVTRSGTPAQVLGGYGTADFFNVFGIPAKLGRTWGAADCRANQGPVAVLGHPFWKSHFAGDAAVIGRTIVINDVPHTVLGVMPEGFKDPFNIEDLWIALPSDGPEASEARSQSWAPLARLRAGVSLAQANAELQQLTAAQALARPDQNAGWTAVALPVLGRVIGDAASGLGLLTGAVGCVLAITCINVAGLVVARAQARRRETAIRSALGASQLALFRQFLAEGLLLSAAGGGLGGLLAWWGVPLIVHGLLPSDFPRASEVHVDGLALGLAAAVALLTGILFGLLPVWDGRTQASTLREFSGQITSGRRTLRLRSGLIVAEIALSVVLLVGAGLMVRTFLNLLGTPSGLRSEGVAALRLNLSEAQQPNAAARTAFYTEMLERVRAVPGVAGASITQTTPFTWANFLIVEPEGRRAESGREIRACLDAVDEQFFGTLQIPLRTGRLFEARDDAGAPLVIIVNEAFARRLFPGENALGKRLRLPDLRGEPTAEIIGVVGDVRRSGLAEEPPLQFYTTYRQRPSSFATLMVRTAGPPVLSLLKPVQAAIWSIDADKPLIVVGELNRLIAKSFALPRMYLLLFGVFSGLALLLSVVGLYGLVAYTVGQRTREIGIRMALGADARRMFGTILGGSARLVVLGLALGLGLTFLLAPLARSLVTAASATDPLVLAAVGLVMGLAAFAASAIPARRATRIDPVQALRAE